MSKLIEVINDHEYKTVPLKYTQRVASFFKTTVIFYAFIFIGIGIGSSYANAFYVVLFFFMLNLMEYRKWGRYYITHIEKSEDKLRIEYYDKDELKIINDNLSGFSFEVKNVWYKIRGYTPFLIIRHGNDAIRQFLIKDIDETAIKKIATEYKA
jgi:hypothetical protein